MFPVVSLGLLATIASCQGDGTGPAAASIVALDTVVPFPSTASSITLNLPVPLTLLPGGAISGLSTSFIGTGTLRIASGATLTLESAGTGGTRSIAAALANAGAIVFENGASNILNIAGNMTTTGSLTLGGTLNAGFFGPFNPTSGNSFTLLTSTGATAGTFAVANLDPPLGSLPQYMTNAVVVAVP